MPSPVVSEKRSPQLLTVLFWVGVAFAPVAALILLFADGNGPLRFAAVLAIAAVVLIGLSIALRADGGTRSSGAEVHDELAQLRRELRSEIVAAAQRGNQALDQSQRAEEQVTALRRRLDAATAGIAAPDGGPSVADERAGGAGRARIPAVEPEPEAPVGRRRAVAEDAPADWERPEVAEPAVAGRSRAAADPEAVAPTARRHAPERPATGRTGVYGASTRDRGAVPSAAGSAARPLGVVRHTETVHVTTRHTVVDGADPAGGGYGGYAGRWAAGSPESSWTGGEPERPWSGQAESDDRGWSTPPDERARPARPAARDEQAWPAAADPSWRAPGADGHWRAQATDAPPWRASAADPSRGGSTDVGPSRGGRADDRPEPAPSERPPVGGETDGWPGGRAGWTASAEPPSRTGWAGDRAEPPPRAVRAGDRWAEVRDDGHARELRVGERQAEVRADGAGYHYADRWASVRQEDPHREAPYRDEPERGGEQWRAGRPARDERPALSAGGVPVPQQWREASRGQRPAEQWPDQPAEQWPAPPTGEWPAPPAEEWPARTAQVTPHRSAREPAQEWPAPAGQPAAERSAWVAQPTPDWPAQADGQRWGGQPTEPRRDRAPVVSWRTPEPEPDDRRQWDGEQRFGYPPQDDAPRAGGHWR
ncbi:hypothetical protein OG271_09115 [Micromonospora rifamycinica]|uniref:hypothetical protein n=1 Tax=Micromonospora rifamycinica TaxID=291594 RepID=UPI002E2AB2C1|nr:hypothetical protein [Micromonospora rifamycinica]